MHRIRVVAGASTTRLAATIAEHRAIVEAIAARDEGAAREAMQQHLRAAREHALQLTRGMR